MDKAIAEAFSLAKKVAASAHTVDMYFQARKTPPKNMEAELDRLTGELDERIVSLLQVREDLKGDLIEIEAMTEDVAQELEMSYKKAVAFTPVGGGLFSRMFFLPFIYKRSAAGVVSGALSPNEAQRETLREFIESFVNERVGEEQGVECRLYPRSLLDWLVAEEEEKHLPKLHHALLEGGELEEKSYFKERAKIQKSKLEHSGGWSVGVLPIALVSASEALLEAFDFTEEELDFSEQFTSIFDQNQEMDCYAPVDPDLMGNEGTKRLWIKQVELTCEEMVARKKPSHLAVIEVTYAWQDSELVGVVLDFQISSEREGHFGGSFVDDEDGEPDESVYFHKQLSRGALMEESPEDVASFLVSYPPILRTDFKILISHELVDPDAE